MLPNERTTICPIKDDEILGRDIILHFLCYAARCPARCGGIRTVVPPPFKANVRTRRNWRYHKGIQMWLTKPQDSSIGRTGDSFEQGEYIFWDVNMWQKTKVRENELLVNMQQKFYLSYDMLEQRDVSLPFEEANPEAAKLERRGSMEASRKVSGKQIGSVGTES